MGFPPDQPPDTVRHFVASGFSRKIFEKHAPFLTATFNAGVNAYVLGLIIIATT
jgi:hypothetical protein